MKSLLASMGDFLAEAIPDFVSGIGDFFMVTIPKCFYLLVTICMSVLDLCQLMFRKIAGLDTYAVGNVDVEGTDMFLHILQKVFIDGEYSMLTTCFWSLVIISAILLVLSTIVGVIRSEYKPDDKNGNSKKKVVGNFFKSIAFFVAIPITAYFGVFIGNIALQGLDKAMMSDNNSTIVQSGLVEDGLIEKTNGCAANFVIFGFEQEINYIPMSGILSRACLAGANRIALDDNEFYHNVINYTDSGADQTSTTNFGIFNKSNNINVAKQLIDDAFAITAKLKNPTKLNVAPMQDESCFSNDGIFTSKDLGDRTITYFNRYDVDLVSYYYNLYHYNWLIAIIGIYFLLKVMISFVFGLFTRLIELLGLLLVSPIVVAMMPLDNGGMLDKWKEKFIGKVMMLYVAVVSMNVFYLLMPIVLTFNFFPELADVGAAAVDTIQKVNAADTLNQIVQCVFMICCVLGVKKIDAMFSEVLMFGKYKESLASTGEGTYGDVMGAAKKGLGTVTSVGKGLGVVGAGVGLAAIGAGRTVGNMAIHGGSQAKSGIDKLVNQRRLERHQLNSAANYAAAQTASSADQTAAASAAANAKTAQSAYDGLMGGAATQSEAAVNNLNSYATDSIARLDAAIAAEKSGDNNATRIGGLQREKRAYEKYNNMSDAEKATNRADRRSIVGKQYLVEDSNIDTARNNLAVARATEASAQSAANRSMREEQRARSFADTDRLKKERFDDRMQGGRDFRQARRKGIVGGVKLAKTGLTLPYTSYKHKKR